MAEEAKKEEVAVEEGREAAEEVKKYEVIREDRG